MRSRTWWQDFYWWKNVLQSKTTSTRQTHKNSAVLLCIWWSQLLIGPFLAVIFPANAVKRNWGPCKILAKRKITFLKSLEWSCRRRETRLKECNDNGVEGEEGKGTTYTWKIGKAMQWVDDGRNRLRFKHKNPNINAPNYFYLKNHA